MGINTFFRFVSFTAVTFVSVFLAFCGSSFAAPVTVDRLEASVNSSLILLSDVAQFRDALKLRSQVDPLFAGTSLAANGATAKVADIVSFLINEKLIAQQFPIKDEEVEQEINSIQTANHTTRSGLVALLKDQGFSFEDYRELMRMSAAKRNLIDRDIRTKVTISEDDVKNYFYNHPSSASVRPVAYHLQLITVTIQNYKSFTAARETAQRAHEQLKNGESFEEIAKRFSDNESSSSGGDLGVLTDDLISPIIKEQLKKLHIGQVSDVFGGQAAGVFYIIKLVDLKSSESEHYDKMKDEIRNQLTATEYQHQITLWLERQRQSAFIHMAGEPSVVGAVPGK